MMKELKPCPFCGETPDYRSDGKSMFHFCKELNRAFVMLIPMWNTRHNEK